MVEFDEMKEYSVLYDKGDLRFLYVAKKESNKVWIFVIGESRDMSEDETASFSKSEWNYYECHMIEQVTKSPRMRAAIRDIFS